MKKTIKYLVFSLFMLFGFSLNVNAETLPAAVNGKITLDKNYTIDATTFDSSSDVSVLDLNGKTLTLNGAIKVIKEFEIKNGTLIRNTTNTSSNLVEIIEEVNEIVNLKNLIIDGNKIETSYNVHPNYSGSGIFLGENSSVVLDGVTLKNNYAGTNITAASIYAKGFESLIVKNSKIYDNKALNVDYGAGAAMFAEFGDNVEIINTKIYDNFTAKSSNVNLYKINNFVIDKDSVIKNNEAVIVGGVRIEDSKGTVAGTFEGNKTTGDNGGALYTLFSKDATNFVINITSTAKFVNNSALAGGALYVNSYKDNIPGKVIIDGATFSGNKALGTVDASDGLFKDIGGGAIAVARGILEINDIKMSGNTAAINKGNGIMVSHANGNLNGGKLTINGGTFDDSIDLGVGSIIVNGGTFKQDMSKYITNSKLVSKKTTNGYEVVENTVLENDNVSFENDEAMDKNYELVITEKETDKELVSDIKSVVKKEAKGAKDIKVLAMYDISVSDGTNPVEMKDGKFKITINLDEKLLKYNSYAGVYVDDEGKVTYVPVEVKDGKAVITTSHLSTYGVVGYNIPNPATNSNLEIIVSIILFALMFAGIGLSMKKQENNA